MPRFQGVPVEKETRTGGRFGGVAIEVPDFSGVTSRAETVSRKPRVKTSTEELIEEGQIPASWQIPVESAEQGLRAARQGLTLGFYDELAGAASGAGAALRGEDFGDAYRTTRDRERALSRQFAEDYPVSNISGQLGGSLLTGAAPVRAAVAKAPGLVRQIGRAIPTGAAVGGLAGLGQSEADTLGGQVADVGQGALIGSVVAPVFPIAGAGITGLRSLIGRQPVAQAQPAAAASAPVPTVTHPLAGATQSRLSQMVQPAPAEARQRAIDEVAATLRRSGRTPAQIEAALRDFEQLGAKPEILADFLGDIGARRLYTARTLGGEAAQAATERLAARAEGTAGRVAEDVQRATTQRGQSLGQLDQRIETRRKMGNALYRRAFEHGEVKDPATLALLENPQVAQVLAGASQRRSQAAAFRGEQYTPLFGEVGGRSIMLRRPTVEDLHLLKTSLDDDIRQAYSRGEGMLGGAIRNFKDRIVSALEKEVPAYRKARQTYKGDIEIEEALTSGREDVLRKPVDQLRRDFNALSDAEKDAFRSGAIDTILSQKVDRAVPSSDFARKLWAVPDMRARLSLLVKDEAQLARLAQQFDREQTMARTQRAVLGGSPTAMRQVDIGDTIAGALADTATQGVRGAALGQIQQFIRRVGGITEPVADDIARLLSTEGPENIRAVLQTLRGRDQQLVAQAIARQRAARTSAALSTEQNGGP